MIRDMGMNPAEVLTLAGLPADLFARKDASLSVGDYFNLWLGLEKAADGRDLPLMIGRAISAEAFDPPIFACLCSPNLNTALQRLAEYKRLIGPMMLTVDIGKRQTRISISCYKSRQPIPASLGISELVFLTQLTRLATREHVVPVNVTLQRPPENPKAYSAFFGIDLKRGRENRIAFSAEDATRPFLTENAAMFDFFEPGLKKRLFDLDVEASARERVRSALMEMLPSGQSTMDQIARKLAVSKRTLQRRLNDEGTSYQEALQQTREELAQHYLTQSDLAPGEISFLLGFQDANSFIRAFGHWTGQTPGEYRGSFSA